MKKAFLSLSVLAVFSIFVFGLMSLAPNAVQNTKADDGTVGGGYSVRLTGHVFDPAGGFVPIAIVGQLTITGNTAQGSRVLTVAGPGQVPTPATFTCNITNGPNGTGTLSCLVNEFNSPNLQRVDTFNMVVTDNGKKIELLFIDGKPVQGSPLPAITGAAISGTAIRQ